MMVVDEFYGYFVAPRELYILLLKICLRYANSELLDERAQILLKHLLDDATARVLEFHSENLATDSWISYNFRHEDDEQIKVRMEHNQTAIKMVNPETIEHNPKRDRASSNVAATDLSNGISSALRRIELQILSLQHFTTQTKLACNETLNQQKVQSRKCHSTSRTRFVELMSKGHNLVGGGQKVKPFEFVHGFRIPLSRDNDEGEAMKPPTIETRRVSKQNKHGNPPTPMDKSRLSVGSKATNMVATKLNQTRIQEKRRQNSFGHTVMRPTLLNHPSREVRMATQQESEFTNTESETASSSSWATQQTNESETTDDSSSSPRHQNSPSVTGSYASSQYSSSSSISSKAFKFGHARKESKRAIGRLTRLKNKLGLIFLHHDHHHHHHHHHNSHNFMWKQLRKIFHRSTDNRRPTTSKEQTQEKLKKTAIRNTSRKNQVGKFLSHAWRSKAMKKKKDVRVMNSGKKGANKLHWWRVFRRRRGVKLPSKGRVKIGYGNRKPQVKMV